ncbi:MAG: hypothetical protein K2X87_23730 [Gemmataceae bacterium]|nr:hypothetical protein [Gemmataceae bacterium]
MTPATAPNPAPPAYPPEVEAFCAAHNLREHLDTAVRLAREVFPTMRGFTTEVVEDPESPRTWVTLRVVVPPGSLAGRSPLWEYAGREVGAIPAAASELICLAYEVG